ncbi:hypothetical protein DLH72_03070 [Candidatus Gracilibacteria bacterium]|nr:MAG: hypothetical protein DLH72_03070 [Candidatus Gracilibacteria bacterium]
MPFLANYILPFLGFIAAIIYLKISFKNSGIKVGFLDIFISVFASYIVLYISYIIFSIIFKAWYFSLLVILLIMVCFFFALKYMLTSQVGIDERLANKEATNATLVLFLTNFLAYLIFFQIILRIF